MDKLYDLEDMLCEELEKIAERGELSGSSLDHVAKITKSLKYLGDIIDEKDSYSGNYSGEYDVGGGYSGERRRDSRGRYSNERNRNYGHDRSNRYSNREMMNGMSGNYSGASMKEHLEYAMQSAKDERQRDEIRRLMNRL